MAKIQVDPNNNWGAMLLAQQNAFQQKADEEKAQNEANSLGLQYTPEALKALILKDNEKYGVLPDLTAETQLLPKAPTKVSVSSSQSFKSPQQKATEDKMLGLVEQYGKASQEALNQQESGVNQLAEYLNTMKPKDGGGDLSAIDWRPSAAAFSPQLLQGLSAPTDPNEAKNKFLGLQMALQGQRNNLSASKLGALKEQINSYRASKDDALDREVKLATIAEKRALAGLRGDGKILPETAVSKISDFDASLAELGTINDTLATYKDSFGPAKGRLGGLNPYNVGAQKIQSDLDRARQVIGKAVEGGVLRKEDETKYLKMLPVLSDQPDVAIHKWNRFNEKLALARDTYVNNLSGAGYKTKNLPETHKNNPLMQTPQGAVKVHNGVKYTFQGDEWVPEGE